LTRNLEKATQIIGIKDTISTIKEDIKAMEKKEDSLNDMLLNAMVKEKKDMAEINSKVQTIEQNLEEKTTLLDNKIKLIEGPDDFELDDLNTKFIPNLSLATNLKEIIKGCNITNRIIQEKVDNIQSKVDSQANEIFAKIKKELGSN